MIPKFRAWDTLNKIMITNFYRSYVQTERGRFSYKLATVNDNEIKATAYVNLLESLIYKYSHDLILMQSTGLKDKNGVEIYVGDIVKGEQWLTTTMPAQIVAQVRYSERNTMFYLGSANESHDRFMHSLGNTIYQYEVIGNIYANPELLISGIE